MKAITMLFLAVFLAKAMADDRHVTNGGGLAELKIVYFHQQLATFLQPCLGMGNPCALDAVEKNEFIQLMNLHGREARDVRIEFSERLPPMTVLRTEPRPGAPLEISSQSLYAASGSALPVSELGAILLAGRWTHVSPRPFADLLSRSRALFAGLRGDFPPILLRDRPPVFMHLPRLQFFSVSRQLILIEDRRTTFDFTEAVMRSLPACGPLEAWALRNPQAFRRGARLYASLEVTHACAAGTIVIDLPLDGDRVAFEQARVDFRGSF